MLLATSTFAISRPAVDGDPYETAAVTSIATGVAAHLSAPSGNDQRVGGDQEVVDAVLLAPPTPTLVRGDIVLDEATSESWRITWTRARLGLGLDHQKAGLVAVKGGSGG